MPETKWFPDAQRDIPEPVDPAAFLRELDMQDQIEAQWLAATQESQWNAAVDRMVERAEMRREHAILSAIRIPQTPATELDHLPEYMGSDLDGLFL